MIEKTITAQQLRDEFDAYLRRVSQGEVFEVILDDEAGSIILLPPATYELLSRSW